MCSSDLVFGIFIKEYENYYYISALMNAPTENGEGSQYIHYSSMIEHDKIYNNSFDTPEEREWYCNVHHILDTVTKHKKLGYIHYNKGSKLMTPKGVKKVHVNGVVGVCLKEDGIKIINGINCKHIEFSHRFSVMGHWRYYHNDPEFVGYDKKGNKRENGRTWVNCYDKQKDKARKKGQIRFVNEYERTHGKMDEVA